MKELRFLVPPTMVYLIFIFANYFYGKPLIPGLIDTNSLSPLAAFISLPAIGFLISQVSIFAINVCDLVFVPLISLIRKNFGTFYFMDAEKKDSIVRKLYPFLRERKMSEVNTRIWFAENMQLGQNELSEWLERRWSMIMTNLNTVAALIFACVLCVSRYGIGFFTEFSLFFLMIGIILLFNLGKAWIDVRLIESYYFEKIHQEN